MGKCYIAIGVTLRYLDLKGTGNGLDNVFVTPCPAIDEEIN
jgi:hypothetical protein